MLVDMLGWLDIKGYELYGYLLSVLWQSSLLLLLTGLVVWTLRKRSPHVRHALWLGALVLTPILPVLAGLVSSFGAPQAPVVYISEYIAPEVSFSPVRETPAFSPKPTDAFPQTESSAATTSVVPVIEKQAPEASATTTAPIESPVVESKQSSVRSLAYPYAFLYLGYVIGVVLLAARYVLGHFRILKWRLNSKSIKSGEIRITFSEVSMQLGLRRRRYLRTSSELTIPVTSGLFRQTILLPENAEQLESEELRAVLLHELAHAKRYDPLTLNFAALVRTMLFFHPLVWFASRQLTLLAEHAADDTVLDAGVDSISYAELLTNMVERLPSHAPAAEFATGIMLSKRPFLKRIESVLLDRTHRVKMTKFRIALMSVVVLAVLWCSVYFPLIKDTSFYIVGDDLPIELIGVIPDGTNRLYDPEGVLIEEKSEREYLANTRQEVWKENEFRRDFIIKLPETEEPVEYVSAKIVDSNLTLFSLHPAYPRLWKAGDTLAVQVVVDDERFRSIRLLPWQHEYLRVDLALQYFQGDHGEATAVFNGPFKNDKVVYAENNPDFNVVISNKEENFEQTTEINLTFNGQGVYALPLTVYAEGGNRYIASAASRSISRELSKLGFRVQGLKPEDILKVAYNERPKEVIFKNINIDFPKLPERHHAPWIDEFTKRLGLDASDPRAVLHYKFESPREVLIVIDLLNSNWIYNIHQTLQSTEMNIDDFSESEQAKFKEALLNFYSSVSSVTYQGMAVDIGLRWGRWPEFIDPAIDLLATDYWQMWAICDGLSSNRDNLEEEQLERIKEFALHSTTRLHGDSLLYVFLNRSVSEEEPDSYSSELALADDPWIWWRLFESSSLRKKLIEAGKEHEKVMLRCAAVGSPKSPEVDAYLPQAVDLLEEILTPRFHAITPSHFRSALQRYAELVDPKTGTDTLIRLIEKQLEEWDDYEYPNKGSIQHRLIDPCVRHINHWNDTNIGGLGDDPINSTDNLNSFDWKKIAEEAVAWHTKGIDPSKLSKGWVPGKKDIRFVWHNLQNPELSVIAVWQSDQPKETATVMELTSDFCNILITPVTNTENFYEVETTAGTKKSHYNSQTNTIDLNKLPIQMDSDGDWLNRGWRANWELWLEFAGDQSSQIESTKLFQNWKELYLKPDGIEAPLPAVYQEHDVESIIAHVLNRNRPYVGWSVAEIALQEALDKDPSLFSQDLRSFEEHFSKEDSLAAWQAFLERDDLKPFMEAFALNRVAILGHDIYIFGGNGNQDNAGGDMIRQAAARFMEIAGREYSFEAIQMRNMSINMEKDRLTAIRARLDNFKWYLSLTDEDFKAFAKRPQIMNFQGEQPPIQYNEDISEDQIKKDIATALRNIPNHVEVDFHNFRYTMENAERSLPDSAKEQFTAFKEEYEALKLRAQNELGISLAQ